MRFVKIGKDVMRVIDVPDDYVGGELVLFKSDEWIAFQELCKKEGISLLFS